MAEKKPAVDRDYDDRFSLEEAKLFRQPDVLCVDDYLQVYRARPAETPERRLLAAVLRDGIDCYIQHCRAENRHKKSSFREAEEWFFSADDHGIFGFENVCEVLKIDPGYIRRGLLRYQRQNSPATTRPQTQELGREGVGSGLRLAS